MSATETKPAVLDVKPPPMRQPTRLIARAGPTARQVLTEAPRIDPMEDQERRSFDEVKNEAAGQHGVSVRRGSGTSVEPRRCTVCRRVGTNTRYGGTMVMVRILTMVAFGLLGPLGVVPSRAYDTLINFDDVSGSEVDITSRYAPLGVTLHAISNPFPGRGPFPAPATLPTILGGASTWTEGFPSALSPPQVAVSGANPTTGQAGNGGILLSFAFDVTHVSLVGNDLGGDHSRGREDESVTLTAYDAGGRRIGQVYSTANLPNPFGYDQTPAAIDLPGMQFVAFNYSDTDFGFYAIDDLRFTPAAVPEPATLIQGLAGILCLLAAAWVRGKLLSRF